MKNVKSISLLKFEHGLLIMLSHSQYIFCSWVVWVVDIFPYFNNTYLQIHNGVLSGIRQWAEFWQTIQQSVKQRIYCKYTVNGLRLQANVASAVLTQIKQECTCSVSEVYVQCRLNVGWIKFAVMPGVFWLVYTKNQYWMDFVLGS